MIRAAQLTSEAQILGTLCSRAYSREQSAELVNILERYTFLEPEHQIVFESICSLLLHDRLSETRLAVHLNNRGFPDVDLQKYCEAALTSVDEAVKLARRLCYEAASKHGFGKISVVFALACVVIAVTAIIFVRPLRRHVRESLMQSVTSAHYRILCPPGALPQEAMTQFAIQRETIYLALNRKLNDVASNAEIRVIFDPTFKAAENSVNTSPDYEVTGTTIRTGLMGVVPRLDPAADAEALLNIAWGKPGNSMIAHWTALWLIGQWHGEELGMAAAEVEQRVGHKKVANLLSQPSDGATSPQDRALLGAAWISAIGELAGPDVVRKLYSAKLTKLDVAEVTRAIETTPTEIERKWQMWIYAYIAGMPPANHSMTMPMDMPMSK